MAQSKAPIEDEGGRLGKGGDQIKLIDFRLERRLVLGFYKGRGRLGAP